MSRYLNPYTDFSLKKLFGEEGSKELLIDFLNQLLPPHHQIAELEFKNTEQLPDVSLERRAVFDIHCKASSGEHFIVEMQKAKINFFKDRSLFYTTFPIKEQAQKGDWDFSLTPIYLIAILDFVYSESEEQQKFLKYIQLKDEDFKVFYAKLHFKFIQMPLFNKTEEQLESHFDKWLYFLKNLPNLEHIPAILKEPIFERAFRLMELANLSPQHREEYEFNRLNYLGVNAAVETAKMEARIEAKMETRLELAKSMKQDGLSISVIAKHTGLLQEALEEL